MKHQIKTIIENNIGEPVDYADPVLISFDELESIISDVQDEFNTEINIYKLKLDNFENMDELINWINGRI